MGRRRRAGAFGYIVDKGTKTHPSFSIRWREGSKQKRKSGYRTRTDATEALARIRIGLDDGTLVAKRSAAVGWAEVAAQWLELHSKPNLRSHQDNVERHRIHVEPFFGDCPLAAVTPTRILELRAKLQATRSAATVNRVLSLVRSILNFAVAQGHIPVSPIVRLGRGKFLLPIENPQLAPPIEKPQDVGRLLAAVGEIERETNRPGLAALFSLLVYTGMRRGEALGLRWADVDLERRVLTVRRSYNGLTKSGKHRTVPISPPLVTILKTHRLADPWKVETVFANDAGEMFSKESKLLQDVLEAALVRIEHPRIRVHDLRHVFASHFVMSGGDIFTLQRILGHSTPVVILPRIGGRFLYAA